MHTGGMFRNLLISLGLSPDQIDIYESLLENGAQSASDLAKSTKVKRTYVYTLTAELIKLGLIQAEKRGKATVFITESPERLMRLAQAKKEQAEAAESSLEALLPTLASKYSLLENKPVVTYYEGVEGIKKVYLDTLRENQPILALVETSAVDQEIYEWVTKNYAIERVKHGLSVRSIVASGSKTEKYVELNEKELRETKVIDKDKFPFQNEINIYGSKVSIINHRKGTQLVGIIINNSVIANTFRSWFELTWQKLS